MIKNYLKIAFRALRRSFGYSTINIVGLAAGLAVCLVIGLYVQHELRYDHFHDQADRIYRVVQADPAGTAFGFSSVRMLDGSTSTPPGLTDALKQNVPGIAKATVVGSRSDQLLGYGDERFYVDRLLHADTTFFDVFSFELLHGNPSTALRAPGRIVLTESLAGRLFGTENPVGKTLVYENEDTYEVSAVVADPPSTSHIQFDAIRSLTDEEREGRYGSTVDWNFYGDHSYLLLQESANPQTVEAAIRDFERSAEKPEWMDGEPRLRLQALPNVHLYSTELHNALGPQGDIRYLYFFGLIGILILGIACINYINLATARALRRAREVGVRKTIGASRAELVGQFLGESVLTAALALPIALGLAYLALPVVNDIAGTTLQLHDVPLTAAGLAALVLVGMVGLLAGSYPAFALSRFRPTEVLTGSGQSTSGSGEGWLRKVLVVVQFGASVALMLATLVVYFQLQHIQEKELGFDEERVITFETGPLGDQYTAFKDELTQHASVVSVSAGPPVGVGRKNMTRPVEDATTGNEVRVSTMFVDYDYPETLDINLVRGRTFTPDRPSDVSQSVLLSESAVETFGLEGNPVGQSIPWGDDERTVIGVVEDFHNESLHEPIQPIVLQLDPESTWTALVRLAPGATEAGLEAVRTTWERFLPDRPFTFSFLDDQIEKQYRSEQRLATLFGLFAGLALFVAGLGLLGLAAYTTQRRRKEIGIRKALGASAASIVRLISREFVILVAIAFAVATPLSYWAMHRWLQNFAFRVDLGVSLFVTVGTAAIAVVLAVVSYHAVRAAHTDPALALRDE